MELTVGAILEGKIKSITNFGAFVSLPENKTGMVHISEVANAYVSDIRQHLTEGQDVKVMVIGTENGKINLSIKRLEAKPQRENTPRAANANRPAQSQQQSFRSAPTPPPAPGPRLALFPAGWVSSATSCCSSESWPPRCFPALCPWQPMP